MIHTISAMELRKKLGGILNRIHLKRDAILVYRAEQPIAVLIDIETYYQKIAPLASSRSLRDFSNTVHAKLANYQFDREEANER